MIFLKFNSDQFPSCEKLLWHTLACPQDKKGPPSRILEGSSTPGAHGLCSVSIPQETAVQPL